METISDLVSKPKDQLTPEMVIEALKNSAEVRDFVNVLDLQCLLEQSGAKKSHCTQIGDFLKRAGSGLSPQNRIELINGLYSFTSTKQTQVFRTS